MHPAWPLRVSEFLSSCVPAKAENNPRLLRRRWGGACPARVILREPRFSLSGGVSGPNDLVRSTGLPGPNLLTFPLQLPQFGPRSGLALLTTLPSSRSAPP